MQIKNFLCTVIFSSEDVELNQGVFLPIEKGEKHTWKNESDEDATVLITFAPAGIEKMFAELDEDLGRIKEIGL